MARVPGFAKAFAGRWHIVEMDNWDRDFLDLVEETHLTFYGKSDGEIAFGALRAFSTSATARETVRPARSSHGKGATRMTGRGWVMIGTAGRLVGHFYIHKGDDSGLVCERG
jgi:hypothetical protein